MNLLEFYKNFWFMLQWLPPAFMTFIAAMFSICVCGTFLKIFMSIVHFVKGR